jgi:2-C-methyl-D-erythritol 4-phosphate cytidylyltransferase
MRTKAFGEEPPGSLLESVEVARRSVDVLLSEHTGLIVDIRRDDPLGTDDEV